LSEQRNDPDFGSASDPSSEENFANPLQQETISENGENLSLTSLIKKLQKPTLRQSIFLLYGIFFLAFIIFMMVTKTGPFTPRELNQQPTDDIFAVLTFAYTPTKLTPTPTTYALLTQQALRISLLTKTPAIPGSLNLIFTPGQTNTETQPPTPSLCDIPNGWITYTVEPLVTLQKLSVWTNTPMQDLMAANCMTTSELVIDQEIFLPHIPIFPTTTGTPYPTYINKTPTLSPTETVIVIRTQPNTNTPSPTATNTSTPLIRDTPTPAN